MRVTYTNSNVISRSEHNQLAALFEILDTHVVLFMCYLHHVMRISTYTLPFSMPTNLQLCDWLLTNWMKFPSSRHASFYITKYYKSLKEQEELAI